MESKTKLLAKGNLHQVVFFFFMHCVIIIPCYFLADHEEALFNPNCRTLHLLEDIKRRCNCPENGNCQVFLFEDVTQLRN